MTDDVACDDSEIPGLKELRSKLVHDMRVAELEVKRDERNGVLCAVVITREFVQPLARHAYGKLPAPCATLERLALGLLDRDNGIIASILSKKSDQHREPWPRSPWAKTVAGDVVAWDDSHSPGPEELRLLHDMGLADRTLERDELLAGIYAVTQARDFVHRVTGGLAGDALDLLRVALVEWDNGNPGSLLSHAQEPRRSSVPDRTGSRRGKRPRRGPMKTQMFRAEAAGAVQLFIHAGLKGREAAERVADILTGHPRIAGVRGDLWRAIESWRERVRQGNTSEVDAAEHYKAFVTTVVDQLESLGRDATNVADLDEVIRYRLQHSSENR